MTGDLATQHAQQHGIGITRMIWAEQNSVASFQAVANMVQAFIGALDDTMSFAKVGTQPQPEHPGKQVPTIRWHKLVGLINDYTMHRGEPRKWARSSGPIRTISVRPERIMLQEVINTAAGKEKLSVPEAKKEGEPIQARPLDVFN